MSAPYPTDAHQAPYPSAAPPTYEEKPGMYPPAQPAYNQPPAQPYSQAPAQPYGQAPGSNHTVIVTQPHTPVVTTYPVQTSPYMGCAIGALVLSIGACICTCWPIGLIALILAIVALVSEQSPETQRNLSIASYVLSGVAIVVGIIIFVWWFNIRETN